MFPKSSIAFSFQCVVAHASGQNPLSVCISPLSWICWMVHGPFLRHVGRLRRSGYPPLVEFQWLESASITWAALRAAHKCGGQSCSAQVNQGKLKAQRPAVGWALHLDGDHPADHFAAASEASKAVSRCTLRAAWNSRTAACTPSIVASALT